MKEKKEIAMISRDESIRMEILATLQERMRDFDYGYSKEVGVLNIRMVNRNKAS